MSARAVLIALIGLCLSQSPSAMAGEDISGSDLFGRDTVHGWVDLRLSSTTGEASWLEGKYGKLRYGPADNGGTLAEAVLLWTPRFSDKLSAYVQLEHRPYALAGGLDVENVKFLTFRSVIRDKTRDYCK